MSVVVFIISNVTPAVLPRVQFAEKLCVSELGPFWEQALCDNGNHVCDNGNHVCAYGNHVRDNGNHVPLWPQIS